jgi:hypothetical protein
MRSGAWENSALYWCQPFPAPQHQACTPSRVAAVEWSEGWWVETIECYVSLSDSAEARNCERIESVLPRILGWPFKGCRGFGAHVGSSWPWYTGLSFVYVPKMRCRDRT